MVDMSLGVTAVLKSWLTINFTTSIRNIETGLVAARWLDKITGSIEYVMLPRQDSTDATQDHGIAKEHKVVHERIGR